jgi:hypothetical protein
MIDRYAFAVLAGCIAVCGCARGGADVATEGERAAATPVVQLEFEPKTVDLGDLPIGAERAFSAKVVNRTSATVTVRDVLPNRRCAKVELPERTIAPGQSVSLTGSFEAGNVSGPTLTYVALDLQGERPYALELRANVIRQVSWSPAALVLAPDVVENAPGEGAFTITNASSEPVSLMCAPIDSTDLAVELPPDPIPPGGSMPIKVRCDPRAVQVRDLKVSVVTSHPLEKKFDLPIEVRPKNAVQLEPPAIHLGVVSKTDLLKRGAIEMVMEGEVLDVFKFESVDSPPYLRLENYRASVRQKRRTFRFLLLDSFSGIDLGGTLAFRFSRRSGGDGLVVDVPVSGFLLASE